MADNIGLILISLVAEDEADTAELTAEVNNYYLEDHIRKNGAEKIFVILAQIQNEIVNILNKNADGEINDGK